MSILLKLTVKLLIDYILIEFDHKVLYYQNLSD